jgi:hypothetical protein
VKSTHDLPVTIYFVFWSFLIMESESESSSSDEIEEVNDKFHVQMGNRKNSRIYLANRKEVEKERGVRRKKKRKENVNVAGKSFSYSGRKRERKSEKSVNNTENNHDLPSNVFATQELLFRKPVHQQLTDSTVEFGTTFCVCRLCIFVSYFQSVIFLF